VVSIPPPSTSPRARAGIALYAERGGERSAEVDSLVGALAEHAPSMLHLALADLTLPRDVLQAGLSRRIGVVPLARDLDRWLKGIEGDPRKSLRKWRHRQIVRIALQEILRIADVDQTSGAMSALAAVGTDRALGIARRAEEARNGVALAQGGREVPLVALGMGKLGGWELNLGSDIDLCFFYGTDDAQVGNGDVSVHEHLAKVVSRAVGLLSDVTEDGFAFRVDLRLRPEGTRGPLVNSLASAERYYESWGRTWERAALLRARPIGGARAFGRLVQTALKPFVFRRVVDPGLALEMREMLERSRRELHVDESRDVKLGRGGIREAEFFVQSLQLIWGGRHPELQVPGTMEGLARLEAAGLVRESEVRGLSAAWARLRRIEHRIHVWTGVQTHRIPPEGPERAEFAKSLGYSSADALEAGMARDREFIARLFDSLAPEASPREREDASLAQRRDLVARIRAGESGPALAADLAVLIPFRDVEQAMTHLARLGHRADAPLGPVSRPGHADLGERVLDELSHVADPDASLRHLVRFTSRLYGFNWQHAFDERPLLLRRLIGLFGSSVTLSNALIGHPGELDLLLAPSVPNAREVALAHAHIDPTHELETVVAELRRAARHVTLRAGLGLASGELGWADATTLLSATADAQIAIALEVALRETRARFGEPDDASMAVIALGKLGAGELGFGSDLDLMFVYDREGETRGSRSTTHAEFFSRVAQRLVRVLSQPDGEGPGYSTDVRLRPSGSQGMLVVSRAALERYHETSSSWERQALLKARPVAGPSELQTVLASTLEAFAYAVTPDLAAIAAMRGRIQRELARESGSVYDPKLGFGGLADVEFLAQALQMKFGRGDLGVRTRSTLDALARLERAGALPASVTEAATEGWIFFRTVEQTMRLLDSNREPLLRLDSPVVDQVARRMNIRDRDGQEPRDALLETYRRTALEVRELFEAWVGRVNAEPPWNGGS
jgi:[glutamine synthetase] adenylyltransferase / [glutamine synthetase]-adenylyl-L-tyrosine phosphorylase